MFSFREVKLSDAQLLLDWRTSEHVTKNMITDIPYNLSKQQKWISDGYNNASYYHWIIMFADRPIGFLNFYKYDLKKKELYWGYYIGDHVTSASYGPFIPIYFYNFAFENLGVEKILNESFYSNTRVIGLHLLHGYHFMPQGDYVISKKGKEILLIKMSLLKKDWNFDKYQKYKADFPIDLWRSNPNIRKEI